MVAEKFFIETDAETKKQAEVLFREIGMNMSTAVNLFLRRSIREKGREWPSAHLEKVD